MPRYTISYSFDDVVTGDEATVRRALRELAFADDFDPMSLERIKVERPDFDTFQVHIPRTVRIDTHQPSERVALRHFLYDIGLPDEIDVKRLKIEVHPVQISLVAGG